MCEVNIQSPFQRDPPDPKEILKDSEMVAPYRDG